MGFLRQFARPEEKALLWFMGSYTPVSDSMQFSCVYPGFCLRLYCYNTGCPHWLLQCYLIEKQPLCYRRLRVTHIILNPKVQSLKCNHLNLEHHLPKSSPILPMAGRVKRAKPSLRGQGRKQKGGAGFQRIRDRTQGCQSPVCTGAASAEAPPDVV